MLLNLWCQSGVWKTCIKTAKKYSLTKVGLGTAKNEPSEVVLEGSIRRHLICSMDFRSACWSTTDRKKLGSRLKELESEAPSPDPPSSETLRPTLCKCKKLDPARVRMCHKDNWEYAVEPRTARRIWMEKRVKLTHLSHVMLRKPTDSSLSPFRTRWHCR